MAHDRLRRRPVSPGQLATRDRDPIGPVTELEGVGPARARALSRLGVECIRDLLYLMPLGVRSWPEPCRTTDLADRVGHGVRLRGRVVDFRRGRLGGRRSVVRARIRDDHGEATATWFNQPWIAEELVGGKEVELFGSVTASRSGVTLSGPELGTGERPLPSPGTLSPLYPSVEGVGAASVARLCAEALERYGDRVTDPLPDSALAALDLPDLGTAVQSAHRPRSEGAFEASRRRLALEPLLAVQARLQERRSGRVEGAARATEVSDALDSEILSRFPFSFTPAQREVVADLRRDLARRAPMRRLLQGDVGSGKTVLGLYAAIAVVEGGGQAAFMAPTELLAEQHFYGARDLLADAGVSAELFTGSRPRDERRWILERLARGDVDVLFGTHALFSKDVRFQRLDLVVIDEQHRFGVDQRTALANKGDGVHLLLMTATPIPRTLALTVYGDLEVSTLDSAPPGRGELVTRWIRDAAQRERLSQFLFERLEAGEQAYWVCPRIGESEGSGRSAAAEKRYEQAVASRLSPFGVELVHGRVPAEERAYRLDRFRRGEIGLLVATTVIEVGVDVANATVMVIENAERLGLAQLHQLRGRVGRGSKKSHCFLLGDRKAAARFELLERSRDGFELAEEDMASRGMGDLAGVRQSGSNLEGLADPERDLDLVLAARDLIRRDPHLRSVYLHARAPESA